MATVTSPLSEQYMGALSRANAARATASRFKESLAALPPREATLELARALIEDDEAVGAMMIHRALGLAPKFGPVKVRDLLSREMIWPLRLVRSLSPRQRTRLAGALVRHAARMGKT